MKSDAYFWSPIHVIYTTLKRRMKDKKVAWRLGAREGREGERKMREKTRRGVERTGKRR